MLFCVQISGAHALDCVRRKLAGEAIETLTRISTRVKYTHLVS